MWLHSDFSENMAQILPFQILLQIQRHFLTMDTLQLATTVTHTHKPPSQNAQILFLNGSKLLICVT